MFIKKSFKYIFCSFLLLNSTNAFDLKQSATVGALTALSSFLSFQVFENQIIVPSITSSLLTGSAYYLLDKYKNKQEKNDPEKNRDIKNNFFLEYCEPIKNYSIAISCVSLSALALKVFFSLTKITEDLDILTNQTVLKTDQMMLLAESAVDVAMSKIDTMINGMQNSFAGRMFFKK